MNDAPLTQTKQVLCISKTDYCQHCRVTRWFTKVFGAWFCNDCHKREEQ